MNGVDARDGARDGVVKGEQLRGKRARTAIVAGCLSLTTGCVQLIVPPGAASLRYRDAIFTNVDVTSDVVYGHATDYLGRNVGLKLDAYVPRGDATTNRPAIVWVHGGGLSGGNKLMPEIVDESTVFAQKGFVSVAIDYRLNTPICDTAPNAACDVVMGDAQHDAQAAVRFLRANAATYGVDATKIAIAGTSAGAITALNVAYNPGDVGTSGNPGFASDVGAAISLSGSLQLGAPDVGEPPSLLFHGTADSQVPYAWAQATQLSALTAGVLCTMTSWQGAGHVPYVPHRAEILDQTTNFLYWELNLGG